MNFDFYYSIFWLDLTERMLELSTYLTETMKEELKEEEDHERRIKESKCKGV